jgi:hypothetical protein
VCRSLSIENPHAGPTEFTMESVPSVVPTSVPSLNYVSSLESGPSSPSVFAIPATDSGAPLGLAPGRCDSPM